MAKETLFWAVLYDLGLYKVLRVTTAKTHQISGVRDGMIGAITVNRNKVVGIYSDRQLAIDAVSNSDGRTYAIDRQIADLDMQLRRLRDQRKTILATHFKTAKGAIR